jgi:putative PIN family toxin of toxin-antitoxin system
MIRLVLDTNVLISALLSPQGAPAQVLLRSILDPDFQLCISGAIYAEYDEVIRRPRLRRSSAEVEATLDALRERGLWVRPVAVVVVCPDKDDNIFLECAEAAAAHYLVTGNLKHFPISWGETRVVTPREFLNLVG